MGCKPVSGGDVNSRRRGGRRSQLKTFCDLENFLEFRRDIASERELVVRFQLSPLAAG